MRTRLTIHVILGLILGLGLLPPGARADVHNYATQRRPVRAAILVSSATTIIDGTNNRGPENPDPHVFYVLDRSALKPNGMEFINPLAPPIITPDIYQRWLRRVRTADPAFSDPTLQRAFKVGNPVTKNMGPYWEVNLDSVTADDLKQFDLLFIHSHRTDAVFTTVQKEKVRKFVEAGGTLWVENCGAGIISAGGFSFQQNAPFLYDVQFHSGNAGAGVALLAAPNHPLLSSPFVLSAEEIQTIGDKGVRDYYVYYPYDPRDPTYYNTGPGKDDLNPPGHRTLAPIVWNTRGLGAGAGGSVNPGWRPYILAGQVGAGRLVFSSQDSGCAINDYVGGANAGYGGNSGAISGDDVGYAHETDLKFVYNMASWSAAHATALTDVRRSSASSERFSPVLVDKWATPPVTGTAKVGGAVFYKNCVFSVDGNLILHCFGANPAQDLDGDGFADDGLPDYIAGRPYDEIWRLDLKTISGGAKGASTPTVIEFYDSSFVGRMGSATKGLANFNQRELVVVTLSDGTIVAARAFPRAAADPRLPLAPIPSAAFPNGVNVDWVCTGFGTDYGISTDPHTGGTLDPDASKDQPIPSPAWSEGVLFFSLNTANGGRVAALDPRNGMSALLPGPTGIEGQDCSKCAVPDIAGQPAFLGSPTVGYVRDAASGALDKIVYIFSPSPSGMGAVPPSVKAFWFGTKGEPLTRSAPGQYASRAPFPWFVFGDMTLEPGGNGNPILRQRVYLTFRDPATGAVSTQELAYKQTAIAAGDLNQYSYSFAAGTGVRIAISDVRPPGLATPVPADDPRNTFFADYTLDWAHTVAANPVVNARNVFTVSDVKQTGQAQVGGAPALSPDDLLLTSMAVPSNTSYPGRGIVSAATEQSGGRTKFNWYYGIHNGFTMPVGGQPVQIEPRLRQLDPKVADPAITNTTVGDYLIDVEFFGTPAVKDGVVYAVARGSIFHGTGAVGTKVPVSVLCAFKANPEFTLRIPEGADLSGTWDIKQLSLWGSQSLPPLVGDGASTTLPSDSAVHWVPLKEKGLLEFDEQVSNPALKNSIRLVRIRSSGPSTEFISASVPFKLVTSDGQEQVLAGTQVDLLPSGREARAVGADGVDNLLWYAVIPADRPLPLSDLPVVGYISSSPSVQGNVLWLGTQNGYVLTFYADPASADPRFQAKGSQAYLVNPATGAPLTLRWAHRPSSIAIGPGQPLPSLISPPSGTANVLAAADISGIHAFEDNLTIIADNKRLIEVNAASEAVWTSDGSKTIGVAGGAEPQFLDDPTIATGKRVVQNVPFARPKVARRIGLNDLLIVDTGNNRILQMDKGGVVRWEVSRLFDDFRHRLRPGDPSSLNEPSDCHYSPPQFVPTLNIKTTIGGTDYTYSGPAYIIRYLVADTGNSRVIELVDVYDTRTGRPVVLTDGGGNPAPFQMLRQVNFVSSTYGQQGKQYRYTTVQRIELQDSDLPTDWRDPKYAPLRQLTLSAVSNVRQVGGATTAFNAAGAGVESAGGSLVLLNEEGKPLSILSNLRIPVKIPATIGADFAIQPISNPTWFEKFTELNPTTGALVFKYLLADDNGCYQMRPDVLPDPVTGQPENVMIVEWLITNQDYYLMTGKRLHASSLRRLNSATTTLTDSGTPLHRFLIANKFSGQDNPSVFGVTYTTNPALGNIAGPSEFHGEVFELDPTGFNLIAPVHGYAPDYMLQGGNFLVANANASIRWRAPMEVVPTPGSVGVIQRLIGDPARATTTSILEQPAFADRPY